MSLILDVRNLRVELPTPRGMLQAVRGIDLQVNRCLLYTSPSPRD